MCIEMFYYKKTVKTFFFWVESIDTLEFAK